MRFGVVTLFPDTVREALGIGVVGRAIERGLVGLDVESPREHAHDAHRTVDDRPFGGGPGMVMKPGPVVDAVRALRERMGGATVVLLGPQGRAFDQATARAWAQRDAVLLIAGRYEGIDERVVDAVVDEEVSLGDFVMSGGEFAALAMIDATVRLVPGALGHAGSAEQDSFGAGSFGGAGGLDCPHWTRPESLRGTDGAGRAAVRRPRTDTSLARGAGGGQDQGAAPGSPSGAGRRDELRRRRGPGIGGAPRPTGGERGMSKIIDELDAEQMGKQVPAFGPGDSVVVQVRIKEGERERLQAFEGVVIAKRNRGLNSAFTVRKISHGEGVERVFQTYSPLVASIDVKRRGDVRRAKLYYLRGLTGRAARIKEKLG